MHSIVRDQDKHWCEWKHVEERSVFWSFSRVCCLTFLSACARWWFEEMSLSRLVDPVRVSFSPQNPQGFLSHFLAVRPAYGNTPLYLHTLARKLPRQPKRCRKECVRNEDEESLICKRRMTKELSLLSHFSYQKSFFLQTESFTIPTRSCQSKHQLQEKFLWNAIKEIPPRQREREKGVRGAVWNGEWRSPSLLPFLSRSVTLSSLPTSPDRSAIAQLLENTANHSMAANGERTWQDLSLSCTANVRCII